MSGADEAVEHYLRRLERAASSLPADRRQDLLDGIDEHIAAARADGVASDEAAVRTLLDRLGEPEEIVAAAHEDVGTVAADAARTPGTGLELAAVLMLTAGSFLPVVGWLVGVVLLWTSRLWRVREKVLGTLVIPLGPGGVLVLGGLLQLGQPEVCSSGPVPVGSTLEPPTVCTSSGPSGSLSAAVMALLLVAPVVVAVVLMRVARRRAALPPALAPSPDNRSPWGALELAGVLVLGLGGLLVPVLGPLIGIGFVVASSRWTGHQKVVAGALSLGPLLLPLTLLIGRMSLIDLGVGALNLLLVGGPALAALYLAVVLHRRR